MLTALSLYWVSGTLSGVLSGISMEHFSVRYFIDNFPYLSLDNWWMRYPETTTLILAALSLWFAIGVIQALWSKRK